MEKLSLSNIIAKWVKMGFICVRIQNHFHINGFALSRAFKQRLEAECFHLTSWRPYWCPKTMKRQPCWCPKPILWELNSFLMQTPPFVPINLHKCWPREWKYSIAILILLRFPKDAFIFFWREYGRVVKYMCVVSLTRSRTNSYLNCIILSTSSWKGLKR